ncbi:MAG: hypothetical protein M1820_001076 [Bogoriella megaspora]|nr:MAG: hypothetical protein M1820_001076 [Bogoriella megaspora]
MADKLSQSLDEITKGRGGGSRRPIRRPGRQVVKSTSTKVTTVNPTNGVRKNVRNPRNNVKQVAAPTGPSGSGESKIIVSNLPSDVDENNIKEYFSKSIGPVKKVTLTYGPNGVSRGICTIVFVKAGSAAEAAKSLDGTPVDKRPMKIEVVLGARQAPEPVPVKNLSDRISAPKSAAKDKPKSAAADKATGSGKPAGKKGNRPARGRNAGRPNKKKTAEELDAEMTDYFGGGNTNGVATESAATGNEAMVDEVMVSELGSLNTRTVLNGLK